MAFVCTLDRENGMGTFFTRGEAFAVLIAIGYDDDPDIDKSYNLLIAFDPMPTGGHDFTFTIVEHDGETDTEYAYWSARDVGLFVGRDDRALIGGTLLGALRHMLDSYKPSFVHMCTHDADAPEKADEKFFHIADLFESCGYVVRVADPYHGRRIWWMERTVPDAD
ncbi:MAG: hypothetical protein ACAH20_01045 [Methylobacteriaceae bacterium]